MWRANRLRAGEKDTRLLPKLGKDDDDERVYEYEQHRFDKGIAQNVKWRDLHHHQK